ncbi:MAG: hypothetical protein KA069_00180 [Candidatus Saccharimonas sp.]|jgi:hypothetical protein|nr:hypothetical protein [Candidatus Saccharimonas sp.]
MGEYDKPGQDALPQGGTMLLERIDPAPQTETKGEGVPPVPPRETMVDGADDNDAAFERVLDETGMTPEEQAGFGSGVLDAFAAEEAAKDLGDTEDAVPEGELSGEEGHPVADIVDLATYRQQRAAETAPVRDVEASVTDITEAPSVRGDTAPDDDEPTPAA